MDCILEIFWWGLWCVRIFCNFAEIGKIQAKTIDLGSVYEAGPVTGLVVTAWTLRFEPPGWLG